MLVTIQYSFRKVTSAEDAAFRLKDSVFKSKCMLEEFCVIWLRLLIA